MYRRIRDLREDRDLKQRELAEYLHCSQQVYSNYELGDRDIPSEGLIRLSQFYAVSVDYILGLTSSPKRNMEVLPGSLIRTSRLFAKGDILCTEP